MGVATAVAVGGLVISAASSYMQASEQKKKEREAEAAAAAAMAEARKKLEINFTDELAINKDPYELQRDAMLSQGAMAIQAGQESERGSVATAGRVQMAQNEAQAGIRTAMSAEMTDIQNKKIQEASRLRDLGAQLDLGEAEGQQMIAANAEAAATAATQQGIQSSIGAVQGAASAIDLYRRRGAPPQPGGGGFGGGGGNIINVNAAQRAQTSVGPGTTPFGPQLPQSQYGPFAAYNQNSVGASTPVFGPQLPVYNGPMSMNWSGVGSDRKLKKNITKIGESPSGLNIYSFEYIDKKFGEGVFQGAMSDEVPQNAVEKGSDGFDRVNYSLLDIEFKKI